jgi:Protein of unknown function (DUF1566)
MARPTFPDDAGGRSRPPDRTWLAALRGLADGEVDWSRALSTIEALNATSGQRVWRLPNINELETLVDCSRSRPALAITANCLEWLGTIYWSSTTSMYQPDWAWALYLDKGAVGVGHKGQAAFSVWAVRNDPARPPGWTHRSNDKPSHPRPGNG